MQSVVQKRASRSERACKGVRKKRQKNIPAARGGVFRRPVRPHLTPAQTPRQGGGTPCSGSFRPPRGWWPCRCGGGGAGARAAEASGLATHPAAGFGKNRDTPVAGTGGVVAAARPHLHRLSKLRPPHRQPRAVTPTPPAPPRYHVTPRVRRGSRRGLLSELSKRVQRRGRQQAAVGGPRARLTEGGPSAPARSGRDGSGDSVG